MSEEGGEGRTGEGVEWGRVVFLRLRVGYGGPREGEGRPTEGFGGH